MPRIDLSINRKNVQPYLSIKVKITVSHRITENLKKLEFED